MSVDPTPHDSGRLPGDSPSAPAVTRDVVFVTANQNHLRGCRSFHCPRQAEVVVRFDHEMGAAVAPSPDWFWCLSHWPALRDLLHDRRHRIAYSPEALSLVGAVEQTGDGLCGSVRPCEWVCLAAFLMEVS